MSVKNAIFDEEGSVFQGAYFLSVLDVVLVGLYFLLVHQVEVTNVTAFPSWEKPPKISNPSLTPETVIMLIVFAIYAVWDFANMYIEKRGSYPWPSVTCLLLIALTFVPVGLVRAACRASSSALMLTFYP